MKWVLRFLYDRYHMPILITENGMSCHDWVSLDGKVHDPNRIDFMQRYLLNVQEAMQSGVNVLGYFYWSVMDNFEWAMGYSERFGLIYVDFETQKRTIKDSRYWYRQVIESIVRLGNPIGRPPEVRSLRNARSVNGTQKQNAFSGASARFRVPSASFLPILFWQDRKEWAAGGTTRHSGAEKIWHAERR